MKVMRRLAPLLLLAFTVSQTADAQESKPRIEVKTKPAPPPSPAPAPEAAASPASDSGSAAATAPAAEAADEKPPEPPKVTGGYSWSDKPARKRRARRQVKFDPNAPVATYPGFRMLRSGGSQIWVRVTKTVDVKKSAAEGSVSYLLAGSTVRVRNNTHPLVTRFFDTPVDQVRLVRTNEGAKVVVRLRSRAGLTHRIVKGPRGTMHLVIDVPPPRLPTRVQSQGGIAAPPPPKRAPRQPRVIRSRGSAEAKARGKGRTKGKAKGDAKVGGSFSFGGGTEKK